MKVAFEIDLANHMGFGSVKMKKGILSKRQSMKKDMIVRRVRRETDVGLSEG